MALDIISSVLVAATATAPVGAYDLTTLSRVKAELDIPTDITTWDTLLQDWISEESARIHGYCNRVFPAETVQDQIYPARDAYPFQVPGGVRVLQLARWPLGPWMTVQTSADTPSGTVLSFASTTGIAVGQPACHRHIPPGTLVASIDENVSVTLSNSVTEDVPSGSYVTFGLDVRVIQQPGMHEVLHPDRRYRVNAGVGQLIRLDPYTRYPAPWYPAHIIVSYVAGYTTIPLDLGNACVTLLKHRWAARTRDPFLRGLTIEGVGSKQFWVGPIGDSAGDLPPEVEAVLDRYRDYPV